jgi:hypothetical protein
MNLTKVRAIDYDKKDCELVVCPECQQSHFSVFAVVQKAAHHQSHLHIRCVFCDLTWCTETTVERPDSSGSNAATPLGRDADA